MALVVRKRKRKRKKEKLRKQLTPQALYEGRADRKPFPNAHSRTWYMYHFLLFSLPLLRPSAVW